MSLSVLFYVTLANPFCVVDTSYGTSAANSAANQPANNATTSIAIPFLSVFSPAARLAARSGLLSRRVKRRCTFAKNHGASFGLHD